MLKIFGNGTLGRDAEMRYTPNGNANLQWTMAFNTGFGDNKTTTWVRCTLWGKRAESIANMGAMTKGKRIGVVGTFSAREYQDKDGVTRMSLDVNVDELEFLSPREENGESTSSDNSSSEEEEDDTIPF